VGLARFYQRKRAGRPGYARAAGREGPRLPIEFTPALGFNDVWMATTLRVWRRPRGLFLKQPASIRRLPADHRRGHIFPRGWPTLSHSFFRTRGGHALRAALYRHAPSPSSSSSAESVAVRELPQEVRPVVPGFDELGEGRVRYNAARTVSARVRKNCAVGVGHPRGKIVRLVDDQQGAPGSSRAVRKKRPGWPAQTRSCSRRSRRR